MVRFTTSRPTPRPDRLVTSRAVEKPGWKITWNNSLSVSLRTRRRAGRFPRRGRGCGLRSRPRPSSMIEISTSAPTCARGQGDPSLRRLAGGDAAGGILQAMVDGVADQMDQRIVEPLDHRLVEFGFLADRDQFDLLAEIARQVVDQPPEAAEQLADRQHAHAHRGVAQLQREPLDLLGDRFHRDVVAGGGDLLQPRLGDDQFADAIHQLVQPLGRNADGVGASWLPRASSRRDFCSARRRRWRLPGLIVRLGTSLRLMT